MDSVAIIWLYCRINIKAFAEYNNEKTKTGDRHLEASVYLLLFV